MGVPAILQLHVLGLSNLEKFAHSLDDRSQILGDVHHPVLPPSSPFVAEINEVYESLSAQGGT